MHVSSEVGLAFVIGSVLVLVDVIWVTARLKTYLAHARAIVKDVLAAWRSKRERDEIDKVIDPKFEQQRVQRAVWMGEVIWHPLLIRILVMMARIAINVPWPSMPSQDWIFLTICAVLMSLQFSLKVRMPAWIFVDLYYSVLMAIVATMVSPLGCTKRSTFEVFAWANFLLPTLAMWMPSLATAVFWNACVMLSVCSNLWFDDPFEGIVGQETVVIAEACFCLASFSIGRLLEATARAELRAALGAPDGCSASIVAGELLHSFSDVVVELDEDGRIDDDAKDLAGFLLQGRSLKGLAITELMASNEDRELLTNKLARPAKEGSQDRELLTDKLSRPAKEGFQVDCVHVYMRDGNGKLLKVELFCVRHANSKGQTRFMAGLREFGVWGPHRMQRRPAPGYGAWGLRNGSDVDVVDNLWEEQEVYVVVDASSNGLPVLWYTSSFGSRIGRVPKSTPLMNYVDQGPVFVAWVQETMNNKVAGEDQENAQFRAQLRTRKGRMMAVMSLELENDGSDAEDEEEKPGLAVRLYFRRITWKPVRNLKAKPERTREEATAHRSRSSANSGNTLLSFHSRSPASNGDSSNMSTVIGRPQTTVEHFRGQFLHQVEDVLGVRCRGLNAALSARAPSRSSRVSPPLSELSRQPEAEGIVPLSEFARPRSRARAPLPDHTQRVPMEL